MSICQAKMGHYQTITTNIFIQENLKKNSTGVIFTDRRALFAL